MHYFVKLAHSAAEKQAALALHRQPNLSHFRHEPPPLVESDLWHFYTDTLIVLDRNEQLRGTCPLMFPHENRFPSELLFGFNLHQSDPSPCTDNWVEIGPIAQNRSVQLVKPDLTLLALMLGVTRYCQLNRIGGWMATVQLPLLQQMRAYGMTLSELDSRFSRRNEEAETAGEETYTPYRSIVLIGSEILQTTLDFQRFQHLAQSGTILVGIDQRPLIRI